MNENKIEWTDSDRFYFGEWLDKRYPNEASSGVIALGEAWQEGKNIGAAESESLRDEIARLNGIIHTPHADDFWKAVSIEAEYQRQTRAADDGDKTPAAWFWLVGYLAGKALHACAAGDVKKAEHHVITTAAALANWHRAMFGKTDMRPGIDGDAALTAAQSASGDAK